MSNPVGRSEIEFWREASLSSVPGIVHGFSARTGGVSAAPWAGLNLGLHVGDDPEAVLANRRAVSAALGFAPERLVCAEQVHGGEVCIVGDADAGRGAGDFDSAIPGVDALVTATPGLLLALFFADCVPVFLADVNGGVVAVAHGGWKGLVSGVVENTVAALHERFAVAPSRLRAAIGPCIGPAAFEVGPEVAARFPGETLWLPAAERPHVDLARAVRSRLIAAGVSADSIGVAGECTAALPDRYFSHRRDAGRTGRMGAFIGITPPE